MGGGDVWEVGCHVSVQTVYDGLGDGMDRIRDRIGWKFVAFTFCLPVI